MSEFMPGDMEDLVRSSDASDFYRGGGGSGGDDRGGPGADLTAACRAFTLAHLAEFAAADDAVHGGRPEGIEAEFSLVHSALHAGFVELVREWGCSHAWGTSKISFWEPCRFFF